MSKAKRVRRLPKLKCPECENTTDVIRDASHQLQRDNTLVTIPGYYCEWCCMSFHLSPDYLEQERKR